MPSTKPVAIKLNPQTYDKIQALAATQRKSADWVVQEAIHAYVQMEQARENFHQVTLSAWREYQETGLHANADEVIAWLQTWGTDKEAPAPVCHK